MTDTYEILNFISETAATKDPEPENLLTGSIFAEGETVRKLEVRG